MRNQRKRTAPHAARSRWLAALLAILLLAAPAASLRAEEPAAGFQLPFRLNFGPSFPPDPARFGAVVENGDLQTVRAWLDRGLDPNLHADRIGTGLMIAAWEGNLPMMELFVARGADVNAVNRKDETALMHAAWKGHLAAVRWLLERGARINRAGMQWSALHYAVFNGQDEVARYLVERGAAINARSPNASTPLMMAAREGHEQTAKMLLDLGADTGLRNDWGDDAMAFAMRYENVRIARMVSTQEEFARAARAPESFGPKTRSALAPARIQALMREMLAAEAAGRLTPALYETYQAALADLRKESERAGARDDAPRVDAPKALVIRAKRGAPGKEKATLIYEDGARQDALEGGKPPAPGRNN
ncbi:MAG: ankyrin repeat domain-containing protein [Pseudomonadota bacterium]